MENNFKIVTIPALDTEVCLHRDYGENGEPIVVITAFACDHEDTDIQMESTVVLKTVYEAQAYIRDYSMESAQEFLDVMFGENNII